MPLRRASNYCSSCWVYQVYLLRIQIYRHNSVCYGNSIQAWYLMSTEERTCDMREWI